MPSKKVLSAFILIIALVAAIIIAFGRDKSSSAINYASNLVAGEKVSIPENPNWQNELGGVALLAQTSQNRESIQAGETPAGEETITDTVSKSFISNYLALKQSGNLNQESAQKLIDQTVDYIDKTGGQATRITQLNVVADNGRISMAQYGDNLGNILKNNKPKETKNELEIITQAIEARDSSKINELDSIIVIYKKIAGELVKMPVPKTFVKAHLDITNGMTGMASALEEVKIVFSDPLKGLPAIQMYQEGAVIFAQAIQAVNAFIKQNNIVYKQGSGGYYLFYGI